MKQRYSEAIVTKIREIVANMDDETFLQFAKELQFAKRWYELGNKVALGSILFNEGEHQSPTALAATSSGSGDYREIMLGIINSPLYQAVRNGIKTRLEEQVPADWTGWIPFRASFGEADVQRIDEAINTIMRDKMPIVGLIGSGVAIFTVETAETAIREYGIEQIFVKDPGKDSLATFLETWGTKPTK